jgi:hypothetical protein
MGYDPDLQQFEMLTEEQVKTFTKGPVFHIGEEVELKGVTFIVSDIAPGQMKLKPKRRV